MENKRLRDELDEATREFVDLKNQAVTVTWLKDKLADYESKVGCQTGLGSEGGRAWVSRRINDAVC